MADANKQLHWAMQQGGIVKDIRLRYGDQVKYLAGERGPEMFKWPWWRRLMFWKRRR